MKQRHSFSNLLYHLVLSTKERAPLIDGEPQARALRGYFCDKAHDLDAWIEEFGSWYDHVHLLVRAPPTRPLSDVYGQLKGFASWSWTKRWPDRPFHWSDGVFVATVDPDRCEPLRAYIRNQRTHHAERHLHPPWEPEPLPAREGFSDDTREGGGGILAARLVRAET